MAITSEPVASIGEYTADSVRHLNGDLAAIAETGGREALEAVPGVGMSITSAIMEMLTTGRWRFLEHLKGSASPESLFQAVPGIGGLSPTGSVKH
jgi:DNA polymerase/3'-5' exonuclease PolX